MAKQTKNILTREGIAKELRFYNRADIRYRIVWCGVCSVIFLPLSALVMWLLFKEIQWLVAKIALTLFLGVFVSSPAWANAIALCWALAERRLLAKGEFHIVTQNLLYKREELVSRHMQKFFYFRDFPRIPAEETVYQLSSNDDEFYIVYYGTKKVIKLLYPAKMYEYRED